MARPSADVDICNLALDYLGQSPCTNIDTPTTPQESICARWYDIVRQICLREYVWNFAKRRFTAPANTTAPLFDYTDAYDLPPDSLRLLNIGGWCEEDLYRHYDIQGRTVYVNNNGAQTLEIRYITDVTDISQMDPLFINIFALRLAMKIAYKFTLKPTVIKQVAELLASEEGKAVSVSSQEKPPIKINRSKYIRARRGRYGSLPYAGPWTYFDR